MPYAVFDPNEGAPRTGGALSASTQGATPVWALRLWPHQSMTPQGFAWFIGISFVMFLMPIFPLMGTPAFWGLLPFLMGALALAWVLIRRQQTTAARLEERLILTSDHISLTRTNPKGAVQDWQANPYWVSLHLRETGGPVENYVTLKGAGREVEIGAFLSPEERTDLFALLQDKLAGR